MPAVLLLLLLLLLLRCCALIVSCCGALAALDWINSPWIGNGVDPGLD